MDQTEQLIVFTDMMASIPDRSRAFYPGTNRGKVWGFINMEPVEQLWHMSWADKNICLGQAVRQVGGRAEDRADTLEDVDPKAKEVAMTDSTLVPFAWHGLPLTFFRELVHVNNPVGIFDFTPGEGHLAMATLLKRGTGTHDGLIRCCLGYEHFSSPSFEGFDGIKGFNFDRKLAIKEVT